MTVNEHSAAVVIKWLRAANTSANLRQLWGELTPYAQNLAVVVQAKVKRKEVPNGRDPNPTQ